MSSKIFANSENFNPSASDAFQIVEILLSTIPFSILFKLPLSRPYSLASLEQDRPVFLIRISLIIRPSALFNCKIFLD